MTEGHGSAVVEVGQEVWKEIPGTEGCYEASTMGRIRRSKANPGATVGKVKIPTIGKHGYCYTILSVNGVLTTYRIHKLIALTFLTKPECDEKLVINHINGIKTDNRPENLEWVTNAENMAHAVKMGLTAKGDRNVFRKHPEKIVRGDQHWTRQHPERLRTGDEHHARKNPEKMSRGDEHYSRQHPERLSRGDNHYSRLNPERLARGDKHGMAKLNEAQVRVIKHILAMFPEFTKSAIAKTFGVPANVIYGIVYGKTWSHVQIATY